MLLSKFTEAARRAHYHTSFSPEKRGAQTVEIYSQELAEDLELIKSLGGNPTEYQEKFERFFSAWLSAKSNCISSMITGPSNFPTRRAEKANKSEHNRYLEFEAFRKNAVERLKKAIRREERANTDPIEEIKRKIQKGEQNQEMMKAINKIVRKTGVTDAFKYDLLQQLGLKREHAIELVQPDRYGRFGFPSYTLTNNLARIRNDQDRLKVLEARANAETKEKEMGEGIRVVENTEADRLQIFFPGIPPEETRAKLKKNGYKWSRFGGCWQRQLTSNAKESLKQIF